jgi:diguanylate cyclase (GGDEF)-like protein
VRGCLVTFDDVTEIHRTNEQLRRTLADLEGSREKIQAQNEELRELATRDPLTGCFNRRAFFGLAGDQFAERLRTNRDISCIMADIDHFKTFNDLYGHSVGDQVIQIVARTLSRNTRAEDLLCRYGGEEFCILLPDTNEEQVRSIAERMRSAIETHALEAIRSTRVERITSSFGIASLRQGALRLEELIDQADNALYKSKENGRNRVTVWQPQED